MGKILSLVSGRGGTGRSALTASLAVRYAHQGQSVLTLDLDLGRRSLDLYLGYGDRVVYDIMDISQGRVRSRKVILESGEDYPHLIPASQTGVLSDLDPLRIRQMLRQLAGKYDRILVDTPAGWNSASEMMAAVSDDVIILETPDPVGIRGCDRIRELCQNMMSGNRLHLVLNRYEPGGIAEGWQSDPEEIRDLCGLDILGWIPRDPEWQRRLLTGDLLCWQSGSALPAVDRIRSALEGEAVSFGDPRDLRPGGSEGSILTRLFRRNG